MEYYQKETGRAIHVTIDGRTTLCGQDIDDTGVLSVTHQYFQDRIMCKQCKRELRKLESRKKKIICLNCGSRTLLHYQEKHVTEYRKITSDGKISRRMNEGVANYNNPNGLICDNCNTIYDYETDNLNRIIKMSIRSVQADLKNENGK